MIFGYIKINNEISQVFINKTDKVIAEIVNKLEVQFEQPGMTVQVEWENVYTDKTMYELINFLKIDK